MGKRGQYVLTDGSDEEAIARGIYETYRDSNLRYSQLAPLDMYKEVNTGSNLPAQIEIYRDRRRRVQIPVHGQGRRLRQQELSVPRDQSAPESGGAHGIRRRQDALARHGRVPALPPGHRHRRHLGGAHAEDGEARFRALLRHTCRRPATSCGRGFRDVELEAEDPGARAADQHRRAVRRQVLLPRRARDPLAAPRRVVPGGHRGLVLGRSPGAGQDHARTACSSSSSRPTPRSTCPRRRTEQLCRRGRADRSEPADGRDPRRAQPLPDQDAALAERPDDRRARHRPRQDQGAARPRRGHAAVHEGPRRVLRGSRQDPEGLRLRLVRPDHRGPHGQLRRQLPGRRAAAASCSPRATARAR